MGMVYNDLDVVQSQNAYEIRVPFGFVSCMLLMPADAQMLQDSWAIDLITKALAIRWSIAKKKEESNKKEKSGGVTLNSVEENNHIGTAYFSYLSVEQISRNEYKVYLPSSEQVAYFFMPLDLDYQKDRKVLRGACKCLAKRYGIIP